jgi:AbiV family abortive infection protein
MKTAEDEALAKLVQKNQAERFSRYCEVQNDLLQTGKSLVDAPTIEESYRLFARLVQHAEGLWDDACLLFSSDRFATAMAVSITCLEEIGKIGVARFQLVLPKSTNQSNPSQGLRRKGNPFYSHVQKLLLAAGAGALVNARLDRIVGMDKVISFLDLVEQNQIEPLRQSCLYSDRTGDLWIPHEMIDRSKAEFYVVLCGELLAEVAGFEPVEFDRLIKRVQEFEKKIGHPFD